MIYISLSEISKENEKEKKKEKKKRVSRVYYATNLI